VTIEDFVNGLLKRVAELKDKVKELELNQCQCKPRNSTLPMYPDDDSGDYPHHHWVRYSPYELVDEKDMKDSKWKPKETKKDDDTK
jgi:hypothetical protein